MGLSRPDATRCTVKPAPPRLVWTPHAWFAAYTDAGGPSLPDIAVAVIVENGGEGSEWAAPIARRIIELYFQGRPGRLYPWEETYGVWATPEPPPEDETTLEP